MRLIICYNQTMKIKDQDVLDRPREKMSQYGPAKLSDLELLMAVIGSGVKQADVSKISQQILKILKQKGGNLNRDDLTGVKGLGEAKIAVFLANFELAKRYLLDDDRPTIDSPQKAVDQLTDIRNKKQEYLVCLTLDGANKLITKRTITIGTLTSSLVHPREVFADAISDRSASIILAHNHPSGNSEPSQADIDVTNRLREAGELIGIKLIDHIIVTKNSWQSLI